MNSYYSLNRREMMAFLPKQQEAVLDVGCGEGNFGELLRAELGCKVWGIEPQREPYLKAVPKLNHVINDIFDPDRIDPEFLFSAITFNDVLEHMEHPGQVLEKSRRLLQKGGVVVASIPNILYFHDFAGMLISRDWKYEEAGIFDKTHLRFFTRRSILRLFDEAGYHVLKIEGIRPTDSKKFLLFNLATFGYWAESRYLQFAVCATPRL